MVDMHALSHELIILCVGVNMASAVKYKQIRVCPLASSPACSCTVAYSNMIAGNSYLN